MYVKLVKGTIDREYQFENNINAAVDGLYQLKGCIVISDIRVISKDDTLLAVITYNTYNENDMFEAVNNESVYEYSTQFKALSAIGSATVDSDKSSLHDIIMKYSSGDTNNAYAGYTDAGEEYLTEN